MTSQPRLAAREAKVAEAEQVVREVEAQAREAANRLELASREFASLPPDQLDQTGNPRPKTEAARLAGEIKAFKDPPVTWSRRLDEARGTARRARIDLDQFSGANVAEIATADEHVGREAGDDLRAQLRGTIEAIDGYYRALAHFSAMVAQASGLDPQTALPAALSDKRPRTAVGSASSTSTSRRSARRSGRSRRSATSAAEWSVGGRRSPCRPPAWTLLFVAAAGNSRRRIP